MYGVRILVFANMKQNLLSKELTHLSLGQFLNLQIYKNTVIYNITHILVY